MNYQSIYQKSKKGTESIIVIEGIHAFKHAARFGAEFESVIAYDKAAVKDLMGNIAKESDVTAVEDYAVEISHDEFNVIASDSLRTGIIAFAKKPQYDIEKINDGPIVFIENPRDIDNVGAVVRVSAAYGASAVCITGEISPWHMMSVRAGAGLQWAVPIFHINSIDDVAQGRKIYACDADGVNMQEEAIEKKSVLIFGTERDGITEELKNRADDIISIPMQRNVSSMNLATSVSAVLYGGNFQ